MVGHLILDQIIGVRVPAPQQIKMNMRILAILFMFSILSCQQPPQSRAHISLNKMEQYCFRQNKVVGCVFVSDGDKPREFSCVCVTDND